MLHVKVAEPLMKRALAGLTRIPGSQPQEQVTTLRGRSTLVKHYRQWCRRRPYIGGRAVGIPGPAGLHPRPRLGGEPPAVQATPSNLARFRRGSERLSLPAPF